VALSTSAKGHNREMVCDPGGLFSVHHGVGTET
jgi:hypothetical protein